VVDLMAVLRRSLNQAPAPNDAAANPKRAKAKGDKRQRSMLLPVQGGGKETAAKAAAPPGAKSRKKKVG
jgi:hypothetical protein